MAKFRIILYSAFLSILSIETVQAACFKNIDGYLEALKTSDVPVDSPFRTALSADTQRSAQLNFNYECEGAYNGTGYLNYTISPSGISSDYNWQPIAGLADNRPNQKVNEVCVTGADFTISAPVPPFNFIVVLKGHVGSDGITIDHQKFKGCTLTKGKIAVSF